MARKPTRPLYKTAASGGSARAEVTVAAGGNGGGESGATPGGGGGRTGSTIEMVYGRRPMRGYPITEGELGQLFGIGIFAAICFSLSAGLFGFALDITKDFAFASDISQTIVSFWSAIRVSSWIASAVLFLGGVGFVIRGRSVLNNIKKSTIFPRV